MPTLFFILEHFVQYVQQGLRLHWFGQIIGHTAFHDVSPLIDISICSQCNNGNSCPIGAI
jgi:hypothetical protein